MDCHLSQSLSILQCQLARLQKLKEAQALQVLEALRRINESTGTTTVVITHNAAIRQMAHRVIWFQDGKIRLVEENATRLAPAEIEW